MPQKDTSIGELTQLSTTLNQPLMAISKVANELLRESLARWLTEPQSMPGTFWQYTGYQYDWRFYIGKQEKKVVFFFIRKKGAFEMVLDAKVQARFKPVMEKELSILNPDVPVYWQPPPVFELMDEEASRDFAPKGLLPANVLPPVALKQLPSMILFQAKDDVEDFILLRTEDGFIAKSDDLDLWQIIELYDQFRSWLQGDSEGEPLAIDVEKMDSADLREVLEAFRTSYVGIHNFAATSLAKTGTKLWETLQPHYALDHYRAEILLRLDKDGNIAFQLEEEPFQLQAFWEPFYHKGEPSLLLTVYPPDFLVSGALFEAFLGFLEDHKVLLQSELGVSESVVAAAIENAPDRAYIFRQQKGLSVKNPGQVITRDLDTQMFLLPYQVGKEWSALIFLAVFQVNFEGEQPQVEWVPREGITNLVRPSGKVQKQALRYLGKTLKYLRQWREMVIS